MRAVAVAALTLGTLYLGWRIDDGGPTRAYLELGAVGAETSRDPVMDSSVGGLLGAIRAGIRIGHVQATLRYLDFNVGPARYGPEVGIRF